jgi:hypothetical protein
MYSGGNTRALPRVGFPIRKSRDQRLVSISPGLIAAAHVLHRLLAPRHPPCALVLLISKNTLCCRYGVFKVHAGRRPALQRSTAPTVIDGTAVKRHWHGLSKLNSARKATSRSTLFLGEPNHRTRISRERSTSTNKCSRVGRLPG